MKRSLSLICLLTFGLSLLCCQNGKLTPQGAAILSNAETVAINAGEAAGEAAVAGKLAGESNAQIKDDAIKAALRSTKAVPVAVVTPAP